MQDIIHQHRIWYPLMEVRDIYKLVFQGVMGSEHLISSPEGFIRYLVEELEPLQADPHERLLEAIHPGECLFRINLRPFKAHPVDLDVLIPLLLETARSFTGDRGVLQDTWMDFVQACENGSISGFDISQLHQFTTWVEGLGFPAVHHSEVYEREYKPAYRIISAECLPRLGLTHAG